MAEMQTERGPASEMMQWLQERAMTVSNTGLWQDDNHCGRAYAALTASHRQIEAMREALESIADGLPGTRASHRFTVARTLARSALRNETGRG